MLKLQTIVDIKPSEWQIGYEDRVLMLGSCFADEMGEQMSRRGLHVTSNPFGTLYNPLSIANAINSQFSILSPSGARLFLNSQLVEYGGLWHSMDHHGSFSRPTKEEAEAAVAQSVEEMQKALSDASVVIVTFGSAWVYEMEGRVVANCHKMPEAWFRRRRLSVDEIVEAWRPIVDRYPDKHWLFTVSPIRHIRDGLHENQLSKATLLMAIEELINHPLPITRKISYFPSYEIVQDELRDYRFYADDLVHPSSLAVNYIWERFADTYCSPATRNEMLIQLKRWKSEQHIPLH